MGNAIDPTTFRTGDIVYVRGTFESLGATTTLIYVGFNTEEGRLTPVYIDDVIAHFPAIRSWSEIESRIQKIIEDEQFPYDAVQEIIALLNEIEPKRDAR